MADAGLSVTVRLARPDDLPQLQDLLEELRENATPGVVWKRADDERARAVWAQILKDGRRVFLIAEVGGEVVGTADLLIVPNLTHTGRPWATLENVVVDPEWRNQGIGKALMHHAMKEAEQAGCHKLQLASSSHRTRAHRFYEKLGFERSAVAYRLKFCTEVKEPGAA